LPASVKVLKSGSVDTVAGCHVSNEAVIAVLEQRAADEKKQDELRTHAAKERETDKEERAAARASRRTF